MGTLFLPQLLLLYIVVVQPGDRHRWGSVVSLPVVVVVAQPGDRHRVGNSFALLLLMGDFCLRATLKN